MDANRRSFLRRTLFQGAVVAVAVCAGMTAANALTAGRTGGHARSALTVSGTINGPGLGASVMVNYVFLKGGSAVCTVPTTLARDTATGRFTGEVDTAMCPSNLFDGSDVTVRVDVGDAGVATGAVNPVPYARYAEQVGTPDCPVGYERALDPSEGILADSEQRLCQRRRSDGVVYDEVVRVGNGPSAFWIDRFEATVWHDSEGRRGLLDSPTVAFGTGSEPDFPAGFPRTGQWSLAPTAASEDRVVDRMYALSRGFPSGADPSRFGPTRWISWFQAQTACRASGKRLPTGDEWLEAAVGTDDGGGTSNGADRRCNTNNTTQLPSGRSRCRSHWRAFDMIGNVWEWTAEWISPAVTNGAPSTGLATGWPADFRDDFVGNFTGAVWSRAVPSPEFIGSSPAALVRGGTFNSGAGAGVHALTASFSPALQTQSVGFRCVIPR